MLSYMIGREIRSEEPGASPPSILSVHNLIPYENGFKSTNLSPEDRLAPALK